MAEPKSGGGPRPRAQYVPVENHPGFILETAGPMSRLWCDVCDKHTGLPEAFNKATIAMLVARHEHGSRTSNWDSKH